MQIRYEAAKNITKSNRLRILYKKQSFRIYDCIMHVCWCVIVNPLFLDFRVWLNRFLVDNENMTQKTQLTTDKEVSISIHVLTNQVSNYLTWKLTNNMLTFPCFMVN